MIHREHNKACTGNLKMIFIYKFINPQVAFINTKNVWSVRKGWLVDNMCPWKVYKKDESKVKHYFIIQAFIEAGTTELEKFLYTRSEIKYFLKYISFAWQQKTRSGDTDVHFVHSFELKYTIGELKSFFHMHKLACFCRYLKQIPSTLNASHPPQTLTAEAAIQEGQF